MNMVRASQQGSAVYAAISTEDTQWPRTDQLLALLIDCVRDSTWVLQMVNTDAQHRPDRPPRLPRPGYYSGEPSIDADVPEPEGGVLVNVSGSYGAGPIPASEFMKWWDKGGGDWWPE
jgi:hypothetical protein